MGMKDRFRADRDFIDGVLNDADDMVVALNDGDGAPYAFREKATTTFRSVCGTGTAIIVEDKEEKRTALDAITVRYKSLCPRPAPDSMINRVAIIRIDIDSLMGKYAPGEEEALKA